MIACVDPAKDVDGLTPANTGLLAQRGHTPKHVPCTPAGVMRLLARAGARLEGAEAVVVGRSNIVGVPMALLLLAANATVTICHSRTRDLASIVRRVRAGRSCCRGGGSCSALALSVCVLVWLAWARVHALFACMCVCMRVCCGE